MRESNVPLALFSCAQRGCGRGFNKTRSCSTIGELR
jgi:hypothetical protein